MEEDCCYCQTTMRTRRWWLEVNNNGLRGGGIFRYCDTGNEVLMIYMDALNELFQAASIDWCHSMQQIRCNVWEWSSPITQLSVACRKKAYSACHHHYHLSIKQSQHPISHDMTNKLLCERYSIFSYSQGAHRWKNICDCHHQWYFAPLRTIHYTTRR